MAGLTVDGFVPKTLLELKEELEAAWRAEFGTNVELDPNSPDAQIIGIIADRLAELWELLQAVYSSQDPDKAVGQALDAVCAITGTQRDAAVNSTVVITATGDDGTILLTGREASVAVTGDRFITIEDATLALVDDWLALTGYAVGDRVHNDDRIYQCTDDGVSAASGGPTGESSAITDGTVTWRFIGEGEAAADIEAESVEEGAISGASGTITVIETPVSGWTDVNNMEDAELGSEVEEDDDLRAKREFELAAAGAGTVPAIRADILKVDGVTAAFVFKNDTSVTDADGRPPHSVEAVVEGGDDQDIGESLFRNVSAGILPFGTETVQVVDSQGFEWDVSFSRPDSIDIWIEVDVVKDPLVFPVDGEDQIIAAIVDDEDNHPIGKDVKASRIISRIFQIPGVLDVTSALVDDNASPVTTSVTIGPRQRADFDTSRVEVNLSDGSP